MKLHTAVQTRFLTSLNEIGSISKFTIAWFRDDVYSGKRGFEQTAVTF